MVTNIPAFDQVVGNEHPLMGNGPQEFWGTPAVDGAAKPWVGAVVGSVYVRRVSTGIQQRWVKAKNDGRTDDWITPGGLHCLTQRVLYSQFTDGGAAVGTKTLTETIPAGAIVLAAGLLNITGFTGNVSAVITLGDGTDVARYNTGTPSVFTTAAAGVALGAPSGTTFHATAATVTVTVTSATDFTAVSAGAVTVRIWYLL